MVWKSFLFTYIGMGVQIGWEWRELSAHKLFAVKRKREKIQLLRLCLVPEKCKRKKIGRKNGRKEKAKKSNIIFFFTCLVIHEKFKGRKKKRIHFFFVWLITKKKVKEKWKENKINNLSYMVISLLNNKINFMLLFSKIMLLY